MKTSSPAAAVAIIALGLLLAGCASGTGGSGATSPATGGGTSPASPSAAAKASKHIDICATVPVAKVATLTGKPYVTTHGDVDQKVNGFDESGCAYIGTEESLTGLAIRIFYGTPTQAWTFVTTEDSSLGTPLTTKVSGTWDRAMTNGSDDLVVQNGSDVIYVADTSEPPSTPLVPLNQLEQLAGLAHAAMQ